MRRVALFAALAACPAGLAADDSDGLSGSVELAFPQSGLAELTTDITARRGWALGQLDIEPTGDAGDTHELRLFAGVARDFENAQITFGLTVHALNQSGFQYYDLGASGEIALGDRATLYGGAAFAPQRNEVTTDLGLEVAFGEFSAFLELESTDCSSLAIGMRTGGRFCAPLARCAVANLLNKFGRWVQRLDEAITVEEQEHRAECFRSCGGVLKYPRSSNLRQKTRLPALCAWDCLH